MQGFCSLGSGSKGNCTVLRGANSIFLIDAGFSMRKTQDLLHRVGIDLRQVHGILVTHDHHDHIAGLEMIVKHYEIPLYANCETAKGLHQAMDVRPKFKIFETGVSFKLEEFLVHPFSIPHDAIEPVAFTFSFEDKKFGICTDIGFVTPIAVRALQNCTHLLLESNHDVLMVHASNRPQVYKKRVLSKQGHLSNEESRTLLESVYHEKLEMVALGHLSQECNSPETVLKAMEGINVPLQLLHQEGPSPFFSFATTIACL
ncbi:MAG: MBL fold metallo-hydrolase [Chlamydiae bacterium]|nr:MBL fold metallo-hydrolase [Chlamydiota bacterium]